MPGHIDSEKIWLSGKTLDCRPKDCEFDHPSLQLNLLNKRAQRALRGSPEEKVKGQDEAIILL